MAKKKPIDHLNDCARMIYECRGCHVEKGYNFSAAKHPEEIVCFVIAVKTFNFWEPIISKIK